MHNLNALKFTDTIKQASQRILSAVPYVLYWAMKVEDMARLESTERMMIRWMRGVHSKSSTANAELISQLGIEYITDV